MRPRCCSRNHFDLSEARGPYITPAASAAARGIQSIGLADRVPFRTRENRIPGIAVAARASHIGERGFGFARARCPRQSLRRSRSHPPAPRSSRARMFSRFRVMSSRAWSCGELFARSFRSIDITSISPAAASKSARAEPFSPPLRQPESRVALRSTTGQM